MDLFKKAKGGSKHRSKGGKEKKPKRPQMRGYMCNTDAITDHKGQALRARMAKVKPFWETVPQEERLNLLSIPVSELKQRAAEAGAKQRKEQAERPLSIIDLLMSIDEGEQESDDEDDADQAAQLAKKPTMDDLVSVGIQRLQEHRTWKLWVWPPAAKEFVNAEEFMLCIKEDFIDDHLRHLLPHGEGQAMEKAAEQALNLRMTKLYRHVLDRRTQVDEQQKSRHPAVAGLPLLRFYEEGSPEELQHPMRVSNLELIQTILEALDKEHEYLARTFLEPVAAFVCEKLPEHMHTPSHMDMLYEDIKKLSLSAVEDITVWLSRKVDSVRQEEEEEGDVGDVDHFILNEDESCLQVNPPWLQYIQERLYNENGQCRKSKAGEDPHNVGLSLEYIFGSIKTTEQTAREQAKYCLGTAGNLTPSAGKGHRDLVAALEDMHTWEVRHHTAKELLEEMLQSRSEAAGLSEKYDIWPIPSAPAPRTMPRIDGLSKPGSEDVASPEDLPEHVIMAMLRRENLLTSAKLNALCYDQTTGERQLRKPNAELHQGNTDNLKRQEDEVQTILQLAHSEQEIKLLQEWAQTVNDMMSCFEDSMEVLGLSDHNLLQGKDPKTSDAEQNKHDVTGLPDRQVTDRAHASETLSNIKAQFHNEVRHLLYGKDDDFAVFECIQRQLKDAEKRLAEGRAVLIYLQSQLTNLACDDPGAAIAAEVALPILQDRLESKAAKFK